ncbi:MAG: Deoxycytidine triphosphate deaminase [Candidatus Daviesbacteria bacterium GW2011_GWA1_41_61]|uniref:Deoxycytidine triphosphate deaminase n=1 Tax=Candidatus Daviesbacteria bacterium GW2011_GWA2_40_9 TaxID=1618424 RepID=A0A0G0WG49_9BACT|nr:MAG: deoxycytidine triphosphate deaminase, dCTP deaminase [Candidatus Daviesbacteria bacterium GW2011_GWC1_40_9]KKR83260.1 MAG: Deoxycytidine triphosphate deaminase [Candidatus Daviesbacteria bacterium GW2011_GWA2_40_9]KKR93605.1 MAG: Deoxycytidine triphosphate deaminase [Candidatus Daviesbacteria bacterium GW2011_GWB1_41_15]KKS14844.1 MAG: Deoxycytidine triphosphate deaminase [Candidatus Daviesbacteria bacterium GW2011_GWA1_41_61]
MPRSKLNSHSNDEHFFKRLEESFHQFLKTSYRVNGEDKKEERPSPFDLVGTLPDWALKEHIRQGIIKLDPLAENWETLVDEVTIDLHLGNKLRVFTNDGLNIIDTRFTTKEEIEGMMRMVELKPGQPFILTENEFVIATTREKLTLPDDVVGHLHGKSSLARLGIAVHSTAARFDPGWDGCPVLEFGTFLKGKKIVIYEGSPICAFSFEKMAAKVDRPYIKNPYTYAGSTSPEVSNISRITPGKIYTSQIKRR